MMFKWRQTFECSLKEHIAIQNRNIQLSLPDTVPKVVQIQYMKKTFGKTLP